MGVTMQKTQADIGSVGFSLSLIAERGLLLISVLKNQSLSLVDTLVHNVIAQMRNELSVQGCDMQVKDINLITLTGLQNKQVCDGAATKPPSPPNLKADNVNIQGVGTPSDITLVTANVDAANKAKIAVQVT
jgi:hypothetical protein